MRCLIAQRAHDFTFKNIVNQQMKVGQVNDNIVNSGVRNDAKRIVPGTLPYSRAHTSGNNLPTPSITVPSHPNRQEITNTPLLFTYPPPPVNAKLLIASSSIAKGINHKKFNTCFLDGTARIQSWPGGKARHIKNYIVSHLEEEKPDAVIVQAGGNDLAEKDHAPIENIANDVIEVAIRAKTAGVRDIFVGGITVRNRQFVYEQLQNLNNILKSLCEQNNFVFIDNSAITTRHLYFDGVHLNNDGTRILADNYLQALQAKYRCWTLPSDSS